MIRVAILALTLMFAVAALAVWRTSEPVHTLQTPELGPAPVAVRIVDDTQASSNSSGEIRIGSFEQPERKPGYEILEESVAPEADVRAKRLLIDTRAGSEYDYELIAQDLKARYAEYDAISVEFTDTEGPLGYDGGALIFNTPEGASYIGFYYGPPNTDGYYVQAAE